MKLKIELSERLEEQLIKLLQEIEVCLRTGRETPKPEFKQIEKPKVNLSELK